MQVRVTTHESRPSSPHSLLPTERRKRSVGPDIPRGYEAVSSPSNFCILDSDFRISFIAFGP